MTEKDIRQLTDEQRQALCFYAINDGGYHYLSFGTRDNKRRFCDSFKTSESRMEKIAKVLASKKMLTLHGYFREPEVTQNDRILLVRYLIENEPDTLRRLKAVFSGSSANLTIIKAMEYALGKTSVRPKGSFDPLCLSVLQYGTLDEPWKRRLIDLFSDDSYWQYASNRILNSVLCDLPLSPQEIYVVFNNPSINSDLKAPLASLLRYYNYLLNGTFDASEIKGVAYDYTLLAVHHAHQGNYQEALKQFNNSFKYFNQITDVKNVPRDFYSALVYVMVCINLNTPALDKKLETFVRKDIGNSNAVAMAQILAAGHLSTLHKPNSAELNDKLHANGINNTPALNFRTAAAILLRHYHSMQGLGSTLSHIPTFAIFRHEASPYLNIPQQDKDKLAALYGPIAILTSEHVKQDWENTMDDIMKLVEAQDTGKGAKAANPASRIIYVISQYHDEIEFKQQAWLKSGRWGAPRPVSLVKMKQCEVPGMNAVDKQIGNAIQYKLNSYSYYEAPDIYDIAKYLIGSDRVFREHHGEVGPQVTIDEETPYVELKKASGKIRIKANFTMDELKNEYKNGSIVKTRSPKHYSVIPIPEDKKRIFERLLTLGGFPLSAEEQVKTFLTRIDRTIEVRSPLIGENAIPTIEGTDDICVKIKAGSGGMYDIVFCAKPVPEFSLMIPPGEDRQVVYDTIEGRSVRVKRDLEGERRNFEDTVDSLPLLKEHIHDDFAVTAPIDVVLEIISFAREPQNKLIVEWPEGKSVGMKQLTPQSNWQVALKSSNDWFEIEGEVRLDQDTVLSMAELLQFVGNSHGTRYIKLNDQDFLEIDKKLRRQLERLESVSTQNRNKLQISPYNAALLDDKALSEQFNAKIDAKLKEQKERIQGSLSYSPTVPAKLNAELRPYQEEGFLWLARLASWGAGGCLADDMGLGKTVQSIAFLLHNATKGPALVVAPASVIPNWAAELERFAPSLNVSILNKAEDRAQCIEEAKRNSVVLSTYGLLNTEVENLTKKKWATVCLDEAHTIKNKETKMSQAAMQLQASNRLILTGTPIQNHLGELWNLFRFINPGLLGPMETFRTKYVTPTHNGDKERLRELQRIISPFMLRRTKADVIEDLPEKTEIVLPVELADDELAAYETMRINAEKAIESSSTVDINVLGEITKLRRAACNMSLIDQQWKGNNSKVDAFLDLAGDFTEGSPNRMLVFSQFTSFLSIIRKKLDKEKIPYLYLDGSTSMKRREELVKEFREGDCPLFLISLKAGGLGLNLPEANYVVHLDPWWNPAIEQQATDRAYRIGQKRNVTVYHMVAKNTIEEKIRRLHATKRDLSDSLLEGADIASKLTVKDMLELVAGNRG